MTASAALPELPPALLGRPQSHLLGPERPELGPRQARRARRIEARDIAGQFRVRRFAGTALHAEQLDHLRVAHLTDLHVGRAEPLAVHAEAVRLTNAGEPDLVVLTGDFVNHSVKHLDELQAVIASFDAPVACVLGNHDHWSGAEEVRRALRRGGALVLDNAFTTLSFRGQRLQLVGLDDAYTGQADRRAATKGLRSDVATLGLSHIGEQADGLWAAGVPLVLSGHTHAGQITVARLHELTVGTLVGHRYIHGLYGSRRPDDARREGAVYVGAGVGSSAITLRVGERAQREVAFFELGRAPGAFPERIGEQAPHPGRKPSARVERWRRSGAGRASGRRRR
ncbi:MAG: metallophosphoesterase [Myxococcota bacterium]